MREEVVKPKPSRKGTALVAIVAAGALCGCAGPGPRCQFAVSNIGDAPLREVTLQVGRGQYHSRTIPPKSIASFKPTRPPVPPDAVLTWRTAGGKVVSKRVRTDKDVTRDFRGRVFFEVDAKQQVKGYVLPDTNDRASVMPWGQPESWEGSVGIPGLTSSDNL